MVFHSLAGEGTQGEGRAVRRKETISAVGSGPFTHSASPLWMSIYKKTNKNRTGRTIKKEHFSGFKFTN